MKAIGTILILLIIWAMYDGYTTPADQDFYKDWRNYFICNH